MEGYSLTRLKYEIIITLAILNKELQAFHYVCLYSI